MVKARSGCFPASRESGKFWDMDPEKDEPFEDPELELEFLVSLEPSFDGPEIEQFEPVSIEKIRDQFDENDEEL
jgi:hypothetical protein